MKMVNVPMRRVLGLPFRTPLSSRLMLVFLTGRRTGKSYRQPLSYVRQGSTLLTPGGGKWKLNLQDGQPVRIRLAGHDVHARPEIVTDTDEIGRLLEEMIRVSPRVNTFARIPKAPDGHLDRTGLETAVKYGFRIVRWHLDEPSTQPPTA
jgi:deazaflavin-dependent oxidoreductase (nitroreductase family)